MTQALKTDLYQLTMMQAYFAGNHNPYATFDYFVRNIPFGSYLVLAGLHSVLSYVEELRFDADDLEYLAEQNFFTHSFLKYLENFCFTGEMFGIPEGELAFPNEPILRVRAPIMEAQLIESFVLNKINFSSLIATKASRVVYASGGKLVAEFGLRRAQGEAQLEATRACFIGGCSATSNVYAGKNLGIPVTGTMAHSYITSFENETDAFRVYSETFPDNTILLIDTYDSLEGARKAVEIAKEMESRDKRLKAVRLDSGNLLELSKKVRNIFDKAGCSYVKIFASSDLNEWKIQELLQNGASIDAFGVGTEMITATPTPALGGVYKLVEIEDAVSDFEKAIEKAGAAGGEILYGGSSIEGNGNYVNPTIIKAENEWEIVQEETFSCILYILYISYILCYIPYILYIIHYISSILHHF